jgi:acetyltransferase-like isoleucine patch superfamily enzyme
MSNNKCSRKIKGFFLISFILFFVFSLGFFPLVFAWRTLLFYISFNQLWHFFILPFLIYLSIVITLFIQVLISGIIIHVFRIKYSPGVYEYTINNKMAFRWIVVCALYTPIRKILEINSLAIKNTYFRLIGMKIGKNCLVGGVIKDPCLTEFGDNVTMGEYAIIYGHIHNYEKVTITMEKVRIGNNCIIGAGSIIMPGAVLEDGVKLAAGAVVTKDQVLKKGKIYGGTPAKEIIKKKKKH